MCHHIDQHENHDHFLCRYLNSLFSVPRSSSYDRTNQNREPGTTIEIPTEEAPFAPGIRIAKTLSVIYQLLFQPFTHYFITKTYF